MSRADFSILRIDRVGSTNQLALDMADQGAADRTLIVAAEQSAGRGRHGRSWVSPRGNFYGSLILRPNRPLGVAATLSLVIGLVVVQAVERLTGQRLDLRLKWPNDIQLGGAKLAGVLLEAAGDATGGASCVVAGLGVNLASHPQDLPYPVTSLAAASLPVTVDDFLDSYLDQLDRELPLWERRGFAVFRDRWLARAIGLGERATLRVGDRRYDGRFLGVAEDGTMSFETAAGKVAWFSAGELFFAA